MNQLIIVGNGFDLAHGLPTSYNDFLNDFWSKLKFRYEEPSIMEMVYVNPDYYRVLTINPISNFDDFLNNLKEYAMEYACYFEEENLFLKDRKGSESKIIFEFKNQLFKILNQSTKLKQWVDIESEYYSILKRISLEKPKKDKFGRFINSEKQSELNRINVIHLNKEFDQLKLLLQIYLNEEVDEKYDFEESPIKPFPLLEYFKQDTSDLQSRFKENLYGEKKHNIKEFREMVESMDFSTMRICFLNFNYTSSLFSYIYNYFGNLDHGLAFEIKIHGSIFDDINFGYGDEMDEDYKLLENLNDNVYLKNFKSFGYSQNKSYQRLMEYLDSEKFKIMILGHSCGVSDRTLLNTIFEHENCDSIQIFYHQKKDGSDNFTTLVQNISRHFNDKKVMRSKIISKEGCFPLPQTIRFKQKQ